MKYNYFKIIPKHIEYKGMRYFKFSYDNEKCLELCLSCGEVKRGRSNTVGIFFIDRATFFANYLAMNYVMPCTKNDFDKNFNKIVSLLK